MRPEFTDEEKLRMFDAAFGAAFGKAFDMGRKVGEESSVASESLRQKVEVLEKENKDLKVQILRMRNAADCAASNLQRMLVT